MPKIGAHVSAAVSLDLSFERALNIGAEATQIFISPPRQWVQIEHKEGMIANYKKRAGETQITPNFIHGTYLINLGSGNAEHLQKSIDWLIWALNMAGKLGSLGLIFHIGSYKWRGFEAVRGQIIKAFSVILGSTTTPESSKERILDALHLPE